MAIRSQLLPLFAVLLSGWACAQTINLQVSAIPGAATRVVAVVDQGGLAAPLRYAQDVTPGVPSATLPLAVPAGGPYRVRAIAFTAGLAYPAILRSGKTSGVLVPTLTAVSAQITLSAINAAVDTATPSSAPAGSTVTLAANIADAGDSGAGASAARIYSLSTPLPGNQLGNERAGPFERQGEGVYRLSATVVAPPAGSTTYYQFAYNAWDFNDANHLEQPYLFWPNLNAGETSFVLASQASSAINVTVSGVPTAGNRVVAVVDGAGLQRPVRIAKDYTPGQSSTTLIIGVPAGGAYRVRVVAFAATGIYPAILRTGQATGVQAPATTAVALADPSFTLQAGTPASVSAGSTLALVATLVDPGDAAAGMPVASIYSRTTPFTTNLNGTQKRGLLEGLGGGSYRFSISLALPAIAATTYYQFAANAFDFNAPSGGESPHFCWPNPQAGQPLGQIATTLSSSIRIAVSGVPATATRLIAVVDQDILTERARVVASFAAGQAPANITVGVPAGGPYRVRLVALRAGTATPVILRSGKATGVIVFSAVAATVSVALADYSAVLDPATPSSATAGALVTVITNVTDPGETASGVTSPRLYGSATPFTANFSAPPVNGVLEKYPNGTIKLTAPVSLPGAGGTYYYQVAYEAPNFSDPDGTERPYFCWPNPEVGQALNQIVSNANPNLFTISGKVTYSGAALTGVTVSLSGPRTASVVTASDGAFSFTVLPPGSYTVTATRANFTFLPASSTLTLASNQTVNFSVSQVTGTIGVSRTLLRFGATTGGSAATAKQEVAVDISDNLPVTWTVTSDRVWLKVAPATAIGSDIFTVSLDPLAIPTAGIWPGTLTLTTNTTSSAKITIQVSLAVTPSTGAPFGVFETPTDGATGLTSSIPVTGWALDDVGVKKVQLWREPVGAEPVYPNGLVYIADTYFVPDARPDIARAYVGSPNSYRAGWGYLMLTNFLPAFPGGKAGNGTYRIHAIALDEEGRQTELGVKTITVENSKAVKPFGTIDSPAAGETISGSSYQVAGWVLTPQPSRIDNSGKDVFIVVDGVFLGNVAYNGFRGDIASLFPTYANAGGAAGYYTLDTTKLANGMHSISWVATDVAGRADGLGSRYFFVRNTAAASSQEPRPIVAMAATPEIAAGANGEIEVEELGRVELHLPPGLPWRGHLVQNEDRVPLPVGSTLDSGSGAFVWQLIPGFLGAYTLEFENSGEPVTVRVAVRPRGSARDLSKEGEIRF